MRLNCGLVLRWKPGYQPRQLLESSVETSPGKYLFTNSEADIYLLAAHPGQITAALKL